MEGSRVAILGYGSMVQQSLEAAKLLKSSHDLSVTVADARFCKPLDGDLVKKLAKEHEILITVEEGSIGGFGSHVTHFLNLTGILDGPLKVKVSINNQIKKTSFFQFKFFDLITFSLYIYFFCIFLKFAADEIDVSS